MTLLPVEDAKSRILDGVVPTPPEDVELLDADGRTLAGDIAAKLNQPPFNSSAMDGYAVRAEDVATVPVDLQVIGESSAGKAYAGTVGSGESVRIFTGAPVPEGANAIVIQENTDRDGDTVKINFAAPADRFIRPKGLDFAEGEILLSRPTVLGTREIALAAAMNHASLPVRTRPRIALLPTGDELVEPGSEPGPDQIVASNNYGLAALIKRSGARPIDLGIARDTMADLADAIQKAQDLDVDVLVTLGGASVGDHDLVHRALVDAGMTPDFWKIAMRPGKPLMFGHIGGMRVLGLPGNPVSAVVCAHVFLRPLLRALLGREQTVRTRNAILADNLAENDERQDYLRARLEHTPGETPKVTAFSRQDSSMLRTLSLSDCFIIRPPHDPARNAGETVEVEVIDF